MKKSLSFLMVSALVALFFLIPFHAFGVTALNHFFLDASTPAPYWLKMWKEILLILIFSGVFVGGFLENSKNSLVQKIQKFLKNLDVLDYLILGFTVLAVGVSAWQKISGNFSLVSFVFGVKYTLLPLWILFFFRRIPAEISEKFLRNFWKILPIFSGIFLVTGLVFFFLSQKNPEIFAFLGYSTDHSFHSLFQPLAYCQKISFTEICRAQGVMSGPNQLGAYLVFAVMGLISVAANSIRQWNMGGRDKSTPLRVSFFILVFSGFLLLLLTFSRAAWIGMFGALVFFLLFFPEISRSLKQKILAGLLIIPLFAGGIVFSFFPEISEKIINRVSSSSQHYELTVQAAEHVFQNPLGSGLGTAGAASKYASQKGEHEVGIIPENWYLQIGLETGILGIFLWLGIVFVMLRKLITKNVGNANLRSLHGLSLASAIFGISLIGLFLHSWESAAVAYSVFGLAGLFLRK